MTGGMTPGSPVSGRNCQVQTTSDTGPSAVRTSRRSTGAAKEISQGSETIGRGGSASGSVPRARRVTRRVTVSPSARREGSVESASARVASSATHCQPRSTG